MKKIIWIIVVVVLLIIAGFSGMKFFKNRNNKQVQWITTEITKGDLNVVITSTGSLEAVGTVEVGTQISGTISEIRVDFNTRVKQGDTLAVLDTRNLRSSIYELSANYQKAKIQVEQSQREFNRSQELFENNLISESEYESARDAYELAQTSLEISQAQLYRAQINYEDAYIKAPISGVVISKNVDEGQTVAASFNTPTLFTIAEDLTKMEIQAYVDEADIGQVKQGQEVIFDVDAYPDLEFSGEVSQIRLQPEIVSNVVNYIVIIEVDNPDLKLMPGMTANITINIDSRKDVLIVPNTALNFMPPQDFLIQYFQSLPDSVKETMRPGSGPNQGVGPGQIDQNMGKLWVKLEDQIIMMPVRVGLSDGISSEVTAPELEAGQQVIIGSNLPQSTSNNQRSPFLPSRR
ncbi:MAG: efflux RND transporter periplasmic adaptor subunit [bacterium]